MNLKIGRQILHSISFAGVLIKQKKAISFRPTDFFSLKTAPLLQTSIQSVCFFG